MNKIEERVRDIFRIRTLPSTSLLKKFMGQKRILIADVGATGNPKGVWREASKFSTFLQFDPDPRATMQGSDYSTIVYKSGLWSKGEVRTLNLATNPEASSVFEFNEIKIADFLNSPLHKIVSKEKISLDSMESVLAGTEHEPDFIKVDAEGADLEILKGSQKFLETSCLGVFVETTFVERHKGAPFFSDIDIFLRGQGYMLMDIYLERWVRHNSITSLFSRHQLVWGDALYVLNRQEFIRRLKLLDPDKRRSMFSKFLLVLMLYQMHDYATEIINYCESEKLITLNDANEANKLVSSAIANNKLNMVKIIMAVSLSAVGAVLLIPFLSIWRKNLLFLRISFGELCTILLRFSSHRYAGCVADPASPASRI